MSGRTESRFELLAEELAGLDGVATPAAQGARRFGADALKVDGRIFAMLSDGRLVVKLPRTRVDELVASGEGERYDGGKGRPMKEWFALDPGSALPWAQLAGEAYAFVRP
ncbi:hypothetical protein [Kitasatospora sp. NPDC047058]|uniref:hypothetical protein n=1 Tax=Kitasatospora sp. NPDC047058 TaxID=3155620 RepID=UPI0033C74ABF